MNFLPQKIAKNAKKRSPPGGKASAAPAPQDSRFFQKWTDPASGVVSHVLMNRAAPVQQSFYFTNPGFSADGRYLWFYCAFPPGGDGYYGRTLGVADLRDESVRYFPETLFSDGSPMVDAQTADVYWITGLEIWKRSPEPSRPAVLVNTIPGEVAKKRRPLRIATHLTRSADGRRLNIDAQIGNEWIIGDIGLTADEPLRVWQTFDRCYNHAQFSPTDPDLMLIAQDFWHDASTGQAGGADDRLWLIRHGEKARPIFPAAPSAMRGHEWWDADGNHIWFIHYQLGVCRVNIHTGEKVVVWPDRNLHAHCDRTGSFLVGDMGAADDGWRVAFFNRDTGRSVAIVSRMPGAAAAQAKYHVHPHPQFCCGDRCICYTTTVRGTTDVAVVAVDQLLALTQ